MNFFKKIWKRRADLRSLPFSIYFNFHYLPFKQAIKLPVLLYKPDLLKMKGKVILDVPKVQMGMIRLGFRSNSLYPNIGIMWENHGGNVVFKGTCSIGNSSSISIGDTGNVDFGNNVVIGPNMKLTSYCLIKFGNNVRLAWEVIIMDTSFHKIKDVNGDVKGIIKAPIYIGNNNWITTRCMVMKGTKTPDYCIFGAGSLLNKDYSSFPTHILLAGNPLVIKAKGIWRDIEDDAMY
jgi:acetyltransferase-like isoleucine patch superfamily enzyme